MSNRVWAAFITAIVLGGCAHSTTPPRADENPKAKTFYPLEVGRAWTYEAQMLGEKRDLTVRILRQEGGYFVDSQGGQLKSDAAGIRDRQRYLLQEPVREGATWTNVLSADTAERYRVSAVGTRCESPAGKFEGCVQVESRTLLGNQAGALLNRMTFAPGVGLVRSEVSLEQEGKETLQSRLLLKSYLAPSGTPPTTPGS